MIDIYCFAKAPRRGHVKTRLAATIGDEAALDLYRDVGERVVRQVTSVSRVTVFFDPPGALSEMKAWLGDVAFRPQGDGALGDRISAAVAGHFEAQAAPLLVIGADAPGVDALVVGEAVAALERCDIVLGPTLDGGYYLIGMNKPRLGVFEAIPWSTDGVLGATLSTCERAGLDVAMLRPLRDVDTVEDARALGLWTT